MDEVLLVEGTSAVFSGVLPEIMLLTASFVHTWGNKFVHCFLPPNHQASFLDQEFYITIMSK